MSLRHPQPSGWRSLTALVIAACAAAMGVWLLQVRQDDLDEQHREDKRIIGELTAAVEKICTSVEDTGDAFYDYVATIVGGAPNERQEQLLAPLRERLSQIPECRDVVPEEG